MTELMRETPWDKRSLNMNTYELLVYSKEALEISNELKGHFTIKVDPLDPKGLLHEYDFYYTDTLLTPVCKKDQFISYEEERLTITREVGRAEVISISEGIYEHGRFHRDFRLDKQLADQRYNNWLSQLYDEGTVWGFMYDGELAGFFAYKGNQVLLQAFKKEFQGRGLAKYFWSRAVQTLFLEGHERVATSISAANLAMVNLTASLGFKFKEAVDVYHKMNR